MERILLPVLAVPVGTAPAFPRRLMWAADHRLPLCSATLNALVKLTGRVGTELTVFYVLEEGEHTSLPESRFKSLL